MRALTLTALLTALFLSTCLLAFLSGIVAGPGLVALVFSSGLCLTFVQIARLVGRD